MAKGKRHILHLERGRLAWASLVPERGGMRLEGADAFEGAPEETLERWARHQNDPGGEVFIFDGRGTHYSFDLTLPAKAAAQMPVIVGLKIRQELGLPEDAVVWSAESMEAEDGLAALATRGAPKPWFIAVAHARTVREIAEWGARHAFKSVWASSDLTAIRALSARGVTSAPGVIAARGTTYYDSGESPIFKMPEGAEDGAPWTPEARVFDFTGGGSIPSAAKGLTVSQTAPPKGRAAAKFWQEQGPALAGLDPVLLGGLLVAGLREPSRANLLGEVEKAGPFAPVMAVADRLGTKRLMFACCATGSILLAAVWAGGMQRSRAALSLATAISPIESSMRGMDAEEKLLLKIKSDRTSFLGILDAVHKAIPPETTLQRVDLGEAGILQIIATSKSDGQATEFYKALSKSAKFEKVQLANMKVDGGKKWVAFQLSATVKGWKKR